MGVWIGKVEFRERGRGWMAYPGSPSRRAPAGGYNLSVSLMTAIVSGSWFTR
jgi:hypothetical protein